MMKTMMKTVVGVFRGGPSAEYEVSLKSGAAVLAAIDQERYEGVDIFIDRSGVWHAEGAPADPVRICRAIDVAFNALHGEYGEDGKIQQIFERSGVPYTGSGITASAAAMHKRIARDLFGQAGLTVPPGIAVVRDADWVAASAFTARSLGWPLIAKPASRGSSIGVALANNSYELLEAMTSAFREDSEILIERFLPGREVTCAVLEHFRNQKHYAFPVVEIIPPATKKFFDYECKYDGSTQEICPARMSDAIRDRIQREAVAAHTALGCRHYSRADFIVSPDGIPHILEVNTLPGLTSESLFPKAAGSLGLSFPGLVRHLIELAIKKTPR